MEGRRLRRKTGENLRREVVGEDFDILGRVEVGFGSKVDIREID
jgi:hypothetical protein